MQRRRLLTVLPALALGAGTLGPFWHKAFTIDDLDRFQVDGPAGRVLGDGAGFFTNNLGYLPWRWSSLPVDRYDVLQILRRRDP